MKLTAFILLAGFLQVSARTTAQQHISITLKGVTLDRAFAEIEKQSGYAVFYNVEVLKTSGLISVDIKDASVDDVMQRCLKGLPLQFTIQGKTIFVKKGVRKTQGGVQVSVNGTEPPAVSGVVRSETGTPLMGATVEITKLKLTGVTNATGEFLIKNVPDGQYQIVISYIGYEKYTTTITVENHQAMVTADLKQSHSILDETVVKGYYSTTNRLNTGDVTTVKGEDIQKQPVSDPILALEGRVPGLYIQQTSGVPGSNPVVRLRGQNSIANGNNPLYIVDGVPYSSSSLTSLYISGGVLGGGNTDGTGASPFNYLNPAEIESVEVLKDADATAIYGSRGANGVVLITTKKGKSGVTRFDLNAFSGAGKVTRMMHFLNTPQYLEMRHEAINNDGLSPNPASDFDITYWDTTRYTNWQKVLIGNTAKFNNIQGNLSGGSANTQFLLGAAYSDQGTIYPGSYSDQKTSINLNLNHVSTDQRFRAILTASYVYDNSNLPQSDFTSLITLAPDAPTRYDVNGNLNWQQLNGTATWGNPLASTLLQAKAATDNLISNLNLSYLILPGLQLKSSFGYSHTQMNQTILTPGSSFAPPANTIPAVRSNNFATTDYKTWIIEPQISYEKLIAQGKLNLLVGITFQQNTQNSIGYFSSGYASDALISDPQGAATQTLAGFLSTLYRYNAFFGRLSYDWQQKYLLNATARRDGSSRFGPGKQFGNFGAVGLGWVFTKEKLVENALRFLSFGKLRASYGITGNDQIPNYQFLSTYTPYTFAYENLSGLFPTQLANPYFGWEVVKKLEGGIELGVAKDRIIFSASVYRNKTNDQLVGYPLPQLSGFSSVQANLPAIVQNTGGEFTLNSINLKSKPFTWTTAINLTIPRNKLVAYPNLAASSYANYYVVGQSLFAIERYHIAGVNDTTGVYEFTSKGGPTYNPSYPGDLKPAKPVTQQWYGGVQNSFTYKGFQLDFLVQFVKQIGYNYFGANDYARAGQFNTNFPTAVLSRWQKPGDISQYGRFSTSEASDPQGNFYYSSDFAIADASFVRLKNIALSYNLPKPWLGRSHLANARLYIQCQNLLTLTHYFGLDPETGGSNLPPLRMITGGIEVAL